VSSRSAIYGCRERFVPYASLLQKIVSAVTSGVVPDVFPNQPAEIIALLAWNDKLVDLTDVVETQREE
jgi:ABC-type glycerol-3-phosphate transport system substrate-binding protein